MSDSKIHRFLWIGFTDHILCNMLTIFFCLLFIEFRASLLSVNLKMHLGCSSGRIPNVFLIFLLGRVWRKCIPRSNLKGSTAVDKSIVYQYMRKIWLWPQKFTILDMQKCQYTIIMSCVIIAVWWGIPCMMKLFCLISFIEKIYPSWLMIFLVCAYWNVKCD